MEKLAKQIINKKRLPKWSWPKDWLAMLISLFFATLLWYFVSGEDRVDMNVKIPVEIVNLPRDLVISNQYKNQLDVTVSGPRAMIREISRQHITRSIDLSKADPGTIQIRNDLDSIPLPRGIETLRIVPPNIVLLLDRQIQREMLIEHLVSGTLPDGYTLMDITLDPQKLVLSGPSAILGSQDILTTRAIELSGITSSVSRRVSLDLNPDLADLAGEPIITARITVQEKIIDKQVHGIPINPIGLGEGLYARPINTVVSVKAQMPYSMTKETADLRSLFQATIQVASLDPGRYKLKVQLHTSEPVIPLVINPETVTVEIWEKKTKKKF